MKRFSLLIIISLFLAIPCFAQTQGVLEPDGEDITTYELFESCGFIWQVPDKIGPHKDAPVRHIHQSYDETLGQYVFEFTLHAADDIDFCLPDRTDRQRNEIAIAGKDPSSTVAGEGETLKVAWKFYLPEGMVATPNFCHVYQIKALCSGDGPSDIGMPILTLSVKDKDGAKTFEVQYRGPHNTGGYEKLFVDDMDKYLGKWLEAESEMTIAKEGKLSLKISEIESGNVLCDLKDVQRDFHRDGATGTRPKWGLYRSVGENGAYRGTLRDETVKFTDISCRNISR